MCFVTIMYAHCFSVLLVITHVLLMFTVCSSLFIICYVCVLYVSCICSMLIKFAYFAICCSLPVMCLSCFATNIAHYLSCVAFFCCMLLTICSLLLMFAQCCSLLVMCYSCLLNVAHCSLFVSDVCHV